MQLTLFTDYSLRTLMYLSVNKDRLCTVKEIAKGYNISRNHMVKVVHNLAKCGFVETSKGKGGGIRLLKEPEEVNLRDVITMLEPNLSLVECFSPESNSCCIVPACGLKGIMKEALGAFLDTLDKYTLADTVAKPRLFPTLLHAAPQESRV